MTLAPGSALPQTSIGANFSLLNEYCAFAEFERHLAIGFSGRLRL